jgi:hypothetical protein
MSVRLFDYENIIHSYTEFVNMLTTFRYTCCILYISNNYTKLIYMFTFHAKHDTIEVGYKCEIHNESRDV